jgi:gamma-glutamyltranspeptidase/glutathione hydrolase
VAELFEVVIKIAAVLMLSLNKEITIYTNSPWSFTFIWFKPKYGANVMNKIIPSIMGFLVFLWVALSSTLAQEKNDLLQPEVDVEIGTEFSKISDLVAHSLDAKNNGESVVGNDWMIVTANPYATDIGAAILRGGGTAADAMVAAQAVLGLVEPQSSGMGGGGFLVWYDSKSGELTTLDGRETAPLLANDRLFQNHNGEPIKFWDAVIGGRSVGVPGMPALLELAHSKWGKVQWADLFKQATALAEHGFIVSDRLSGLLEHEHTRMSSSTKAKSYFFPKGQPLAQGELLINRDYAALMRQLADNGSDIFYFGPIADAIVYKVRENPRNPGLLNHEDLANYAVKERPALCTKFRNYEVCGMGPPSSGAIGVGQILGMINKFPKGKIRDPQTLRLIGDATRLAFADRGRYVADGDFVSVPTKELVEEQYLSKRASLLNRRNAIPVVTAGEPIASLTHRWAPDLSIEKPSTTHVSIIDAYGNALSLTSSIENAFGSRLMTNGFLLNNQLTDFSFRSSANGTPIANRVEGGKRPRSSMAPTIVLEDGKIVLLIGSPGGSRIIPYVSNTIVAILDWGLDVQEAVSQPHAVNRFGIYEIEEGTSLTGLKKWLQELGYEIKERPLNSGLNVILKKDGKLYGGSDPRREGIAIGG